MSKQQSCLNWAPARTYSSTTFKDGPVKSDKWDQGDRNFFAKILAKQYMEIMEKLEG